jgi:hypothetical protein
MATGVSQIGPLVLAVPGGQQPGTTQTWFFDIEFTLRAISFTVDALTANTELRVDNIRHLLLPGSRRRVLVDVVNVGSVATNYGITAGLIFPV